MREGSAVDPGLAGIAVKQPIALHAREARPRLAVPNGLEDKSLWIKTVRRPVEIFTDRLGAVQIDRHSVRLTALDGHQEDRELGVIAEIPHAKPARFGTARADIEVDVQQRAIAQTLQRLYVRCVEHCTHLALRQGRGLARADSSIAGLGSPHAGDRVGLGELLVGQMLVERRQRREPAGDRRLGEFGRFHRCAPGEYVGLTDLVELVRRADANRGDEGRDGALIGIAGVLG